MRALCALALFAVAGSAENLVFTTRVHVACPVQISGIVQSKDVGFESVLIRNETGKAIDSIQLKVSLISEAGEEVVEKATFLVMLGPGQRRRVTVGMGRVPDLAAKAHVSHRPVVQATLYVASANFTDGERWSGEEPYINDPVAPPPPRK